MMFELPKEKVKASRINPKKIILFSKPKVGKTEALSALDNCLLIDLENGSEFVNAMKINILQLAKEASEKEKKEISPISILKEVIEKIKDANKKAGKFVYKYGAIDTVSALKNVKIAKILGFINYFSYICIN